MAAAGAIGERRLGRTELRVTELGLGAMDTPNAKEGAATVHAALDAGISFIDTAREYAGSEFLLGQVLRERAEAGRAPAALHLASKTFSHTIDGSQRDVDRSLSVLGRERISLYQLHDISSAPAWAEATGPDGALEGLQIAQYRGLIEHIGISTHDLDIARVAIESGHFATVMLEYSAFYPESAPLLDLAHRHDVGVIVMRPLGGSGRTSVMRGRREAGTAGILTARNLLRYVLSHPAVSTAIPGARYPDRVEENVATVTAMEPMEPAELRALEEAAGALYDDGA